MKKRLLYILIFSLCFSICSSQQKNDSVRVKWKYQPNFAIGFDVLHAGLSAFTKRKMFQGFVSSRLTKVLYAVADVGFDKNYYAKNGYDASANGIFIKAGAVRMLVMDPDNLRNGLYAGGKLAGSFYSQEYAAVPVRGYNGGDVSVSYPKSTQSSYWLEGSVGGRVQLFKSNFYIDVNMQPRFLLFNTKQEDLTPMIVPGFGKSSTKFNTGFSWNVAWQF